MLLKSLELQGFKTFPDKTELSFEEGITSVVGPNGSGKSNISDAMRWVLGEQSVRILRCSKMEDVVFSGTPGRKAQGYAEVTLTIDNSDRRLDFDNDTVAVTRRYYRSGESEYLINKTMVRLKDINEMFMDTGLGRDGYSIIGQGKIDAIVGAKSEDRREIFEEASGISKFRYRKEESERQLSRAEENLVRLRDILAELETRVGPLKEQAEKAQKFIEYDAEKKDIEIGIWLETLNSSGKILREHEDKIAAAQREHEEAENEIAGVTEKIEKNYRDTNECTAKMDELRSEAAELDEKATRTEGEISVLMNDISHNNQDALRVKKQIEDAERSNVDVDCEIESKKTLSAEAEKNVEESRKRRDEYAERLETLRENADKATEKIEAATAEMSLFNAELSDKRAELSSMESAVSEIALRAGAVDGNIQQNDEKLADLQKEQKDLEAMLSDTDEKISQGENTLKGHELKAASRRTKAEQAQEELNKLMLDAGESERRVKLLEDLERSLEGFSQSVKAVMKESDHGMLSGICGPVTKLLKVPREYAVALETALGAAMQNLVVETEQDAKNAIHFLKQKEIGRATFLPITTVKGSAISRRDIEDMPGFVGVASELCSCDAKYDGIKQSLLGRVAVAEDLDSAVAIAKKTQYRTRVVSLDGQVVNAGGSLTGGAKARNSGLLSRASEIERISERAKLQRAKAAEAKKDLDELRNELSMSAAETDAVRAELSTYQEERIKIVSESARAARDIEQTKTQAQELALEKENSEKRVQDIKTGIAGVSKKIIELEEQTAKAEEELKSLGSGREEQLARCSDISVAIQEIHIQELSAQKDLENLNAAINELKQRKENSADVVGRMKKEIEELAEKSRQLEAGIEEKKKLSAEFREQAQGKRKLSEETAKIRAELEKLSGELRKRERDAGTRRENLASELSRLRERSENLQREYDGIISKLWDEYELTRREAEEMDIKIEDLAKAQRRLNELRSRIKALGAVNVGAVVEYEEVSSRYEFMKNQMDDVERSKAGLIKLIGDLTVQMKEQFIERFALINRNFSEIFKELFGGGAAELSFTDTENILSSGIEIKVHPPGKIVTHIESLSGGEKALVAISIYFAIMRVNPPPFCVLDEIEAALDDVNVARFAQYLRRMSGNTQFITITHRRGTMEESDMLYGVTMQDQGISKLLALKTHEDAALKLGV